MAEKQITSGDQAYAAIREMIASGELAPGQKVSQRRLAKQLGCSTVPVLEAMRRLESDGLLSTAPHCMARVRELATEDFEGLYMVREGLEAVAARLAATRISDEAIKELQQLSENFDAAMAQRDRAAMSRFDVAIHKLIASQSRCTLLGEELDRLTLIERTAGQMIQINDAAEPSYSSHRALIEALRDRDPDAAEYFMKKHIQAGYLDRVRSSDHTS